MRVVQRHPEPRGAMQMPAGVGGEGQRGCCGAAHRPLLVAHWGQKPSFVPHSRPLFSSARSPQQLGRVLRLAWVSLVCASVAGAVGASASLPGRGHACRRWPCMHMYPPAGPPQQRAARAREAAVCIHGNHRHHQHRRGPGRVHSDGAWTPLTGPSHTIRMCVHHILYCAKHTYSCLPCRPEVFRAYGPGSLNLTQRRAGEQTGRGGWAKGAYVRSIERLPADSPHARSPSSTKAHIRLVLATTWHAVQGALPLPATPSQVV